MADQDPNRPVDPNRPQDPNRPPASRPLTSLPPQPYQLINADHTFTPYYPTPTAAQRFAPQHVTPHLSSGLRHPAENFPEPRNLFPGSDPIMDAREEGGERSGQLSYEQVAALRDVKDLTVAERHARDEKEFPVSPPHGLKPAQQQRWTELREKLFETNNILGEGTEGQDPDQYKTRPRGELRKLKELADFQGGN